MKKLAAAEAAFVGSEFLAPVVRGRGVTVKIVGVRCALSVSPPDFHGWGIFRADSHTHATLLREAAALQRQAYLRLFPSISLIICSGQSSAPRATPADLSDSRFHFDGPVPVDLSPRLDLFDVVVAGFDGTRFWFDRIEPRADPAAAAYLRREIVQMTDPKQLQRPGLTAGQRVAYAMEYVRRAEAILADRQRQADERLKQALAHAGAILCDFTDAEDAYRVTFNVDGRRFTSIVRKDDLTVQSAGICLSGQDRDFDLNSLVGVLREGDSEGSLLRY
jgi:hypothetical protein